MGFVLPIATWVHGVWVHGQFAHRHQTYGVRSMRMEGPYPGSEYDSEKCPFWPAVFRKNGYQTAQVGKWHTGTDNGFGRDWDFQKGMEPSRLFPRIPEIISRNNSFRQMAIKR